MKLINENSNCILILGMHKSGTSTLSGSLNQNGIEIIHSNRINMNYPYGYMEENKIINLNEKILEYSGGRWYAPPSTISWNVIHKIRGSLILKKYFFKKKWGFKDPRVLFTLPFWQSVIKEGMFFVGTFRHPLSVAKSLNYYNNIPLENGVELWEKYNTKLLELYYKYKFPIISYDLDKKMYDEGIIRILKILYGLDFKKKYKSFYKKNYQKKSYDIDGIFNLRTDILQIYYELKNISVI